MPVSNEPHCKNAVSILNTGLKLESKIYVSRNIASEVCMSIFILFFPFFIFVLEGMTGSVSRTEVRSSYHASRLYAAMDIIIITIIVVIIPLYGLLKCHPYSSKALFYHM